MPPDREEVESRCFRAMRTSKSNLSTPACLNRSIDRSLGSHRLWLPPILPFEEGRSRKWGTWTAVNGEDGLGLDLRRRPRSLSMRAAQARCWSGARSRVGTHRDRPTRRTEQRRTIGTLPTAPGACPQASRSRAGTARCRLCPRLCPRAAKTTQPRPPPPKNLRPRLSTIHAVEVVIFQVPRG